MDYIKIYSDFLKKRLNPSKKLKVIFDCSNGTTGLVLKKIFSNYQLLITNYLNSKPDGNSPAHGPDPSKKSAISNLQLAIKKNKADLGVIFDADGDRVFFIDNLGRFIDPDVITRLLIWHLESKEIVIDVRTGWLITKLKMKNEKLKIFESKAGHYFIKKLMQKINADFGAEKAGHYYFRKSDANLRISSESTNKSELYYDDGILAAIEVINAVSKLPYSMADFNDLLRQCYRSGEININMNDELGIRNYKNMFEQIENRYKSTTTKISYLDGLTIEADDWWFNLRPSNTEPVMRLNIEAENQKTLEDLTKEIINLIK